MSWLQRSTPLRRSKPIRRKAARRLSRPESDPAYLAWVRTQRCPAGKGDDECSGPVHAHHAGKRPGMGMKAPDSTAIPLCRKHHEYWHGGHGLFRGLTQEQRREWSDAHITETRSRFDAEAVAAPRGGR